MQAGNTVTNLPLSQNRVAADSASETRISPLHPKLSFSSDGIKPESRDPAFSSGSQLSVYNAEVDVSLRDFHNSDFETLWHIDQQCFAPGISYSQPELAAYIRVLNSFTLVAENASSDPPRILGFLIATTNRRRQGHIITIDVLPQAQRFGVGSKLLTAAEDRLRARQCASVFLETAVNNAPALAFYKRHHYFVRKTLPRYYPDGLDALVLEKNLLSALSGK